jgi:hypothetical protein
LTGPRTIRIDLRPSDAARLDLMAARTGLSAEQLAADLLGDFLASAMRRTERPAGGRGTDYPARALAFISGEAVR